MSWEERVNKILGRFPSWWKKDSESNTYGLVKSFSSEFDSLSDEALALKLEIYVNTATGKYLDDLGKIFKVFRIPGETDAQFRARIIAYWPGFSGCGTADAIKDVIFKMTNVPKEDVTITDIPNELKFEADVIIPDEETIHLIDVIRDTIWKIKAAGVYPLITWILTGELVTDSLSVKDTVSILPTPTDVAFKWELSLIEGAATFEAI